MDVKIVQSTQGLSDLQSDWERIEQQDPDATFYGTHRYISAWWDSYSHNPSVNLYVACVYQNNELVGIAPLAIVTEKKKNTQRKTLRFAVPGDYHTVLVDPQHNPQTVLKYLFKHLDKNPAWDVMKLRNIPGKSKLAIYLFKSEDNQNFVYHLENPYIDLKAYRDFDDFTSNCLPSTVVNLRNKLMREVGFTFQVYQGNENNILENISQLHRLEKEYLVQQMGRDERHSLYEDNYRDNHIKNVFTNTDNAITFVYHDTAGNLIGYRTGYLYKRTLLSWNSAYDPRYAKYRIGKIIQYDILHHLFGNQTADIFDWGAGRYAWKFEWTSMYTTSYKFQKTVNPIVKEKKSVSTKPQLKSKEKSKKVKKKPKKKSNPFAKLKKRLVNIKNKLIKKRPTTPVIWYIPHPDDEALFMAGSIYEHKQRENIVVLLTAGGASKAINTVNSKLAVPLTTEQFMDARVKEFKAAMVALGIKAQNIITHNLPDGALTKSQIYRVMLQMERQYPGSSHKTMSYHDPHRDHRTAGKALQKAYAKGKIRDARFYLPTSIQHQHKGFNVNFSKSTVISKQQVLSQYMLWDPEQGRYAIGANSVQSLFDQQCNAPEEKIHLPRKPKS